MAQLGEEVKVYIVQRLACYESLENVANGVKEDFGVEVSKPQIQNYDPTKAQGKDLSAKFVELFNETRKKFIDDISTIPISNKSVRLATLQRLADKAEKSKNMVLVASLLEQAAKEVGEAYTNKHKLEHTSPDGSMTPKPAIDASKLSTSALAEILAAQDQSEK